MQVTGPSVNLNGPGLDAYAPNVDVPGLHNNYTTTTTTTTEAFQNGGNLANYNYDYNAGQNGYTNGGYNASDANVNYDYDGNYGDETRTGCCNRRNKFVDEFGHKRFGNEYAGNPSTLTCRKCCTGLLIALLCLLLLGGLIAGIMAAVTRGTFNFNSSSSSSSSSSSAEANEIAGGYPGGILVNGVLVVPITAAPQRFYFIYGTEMPCNPFNNNTVTSIPSNFPNCNQVTTRIIPAISWSTTTPKTVYLYAGGSGAPRRAMAGVWLNFVAPILFGLAVYWHQ